MRVGNEQRRCVCVRWVRPKTSCLRDSAAHAATVEFPEQFAVISSPENEGFT
jgi:hypothetical protein